MGFEITEMGGVIGIDLSTSHAGIYSIGKGGDGWTLLVNKKKHCISKNTALLDAKGKDEDSANYEMRRLDLVYSTIADEVVRYLHHLGPVTYIEDGKTSCQFNFAVLEDYAFAVHSRSVTGIAQTGGVVRHLLYCWGIPIRLHDPTSVKIFATGKGNATKLEVVNAALAGGLQIDPRLLSEVKGGKDVDGPGTDLADAFWLAKMGELEIKVRLGEVGLADLEERERRIFLRTTKAMPVNLLDRPFIGNDF